MIEVRIDEPVRAIVTVQSWLGRLLRLRKPDPRWAVRWGVEWYWEASGLQILNATIIEELDRALLQWEYQQVPRRLDEHQLIHTPR